MLDANEHGGLVVSRNEQRYGNRRAEESPRARRAHHAERWLVHGGVMLLMMVVAVCSLSLASCQTMQEEFGIEGGAVADRGGRGGADLDGNERGSTRKGEVRDQVQDLASAGEPIIRVRILTAVTEVELSSAGSGGMVASVGESVLGDPMSVSRRGGGAGLGGGLPGVKMSPIGMGGSAVRIALDQGTFVVRQIGGVMGAVEASGQSAAIARYPSAGGVVFAGIGLEGSRGSGAGESGERLRVNKKEYPGRIRLLARSDVSEGAFDVIELVPLEEYLVGVVAKELYPNWPVGAFEVQSVCARTYALHERARSMAEGETFDVEASEADQAYDGHSTNGRALQGVRNTRGMVLMDHGHVLRAYYSSTCGGRTGAARDTWPTYRGFEFNLAEPIQENFRSHYCQQSPRYEWEVTRDRDELAARLRAFGKSQEMMVRQLKELRGIEVMSKNRVGRPNKYRVIDVGGTWYQLTAEQLRIACNTSVPGLPGIDGKSRVLSSDFAVEIRGNAVTFNGRGFGHGVGMCQYCTKTLAQDGRDWRNIVQMFYPGAELKKIY